MNHSAKPDAPQPAGANAPAKKKSSAWKWWVGILFLGTVGAVIYFFPPKPAAVASGPGGPGMGGGMRGGGGGGGGGGGRSGRMGGNGPTPVSSALVETGELRLYLTALGSATALNTITVKSRADGQLQKIHFTEGQLVKEGDLLAEIDPRQYEVSLAQAQGQLARDTAQLENAKRDLERYESAREAITQQQLDQARATVAQYTGTVQADQGSVDNYKLQLSYCRITAPISGRVGLRMVDEGNLVRTSDAGLCVITEEEPISVIFSIPEDNLPLIRKSLAAGQELSVEAFDRSMKNSLATGKLIALDNQIDVTTGTVRLKAQFDNKDHSLFPNQFVNVRMLTGVMSDVLLIPNSAVQLNGQARFVFVVADDAVTRRAIKVGRTEGEKTVVTEGLNAGEVVVTEGVDRLMDGSRVTTKTPVPQAPVSAGRRGMGGPGGERKGNFQRGGADGSKRGGEGWKQRGGADGTSGAAPASSAPQATDSKKSP
jgi:multidrug efflux system membrane fusion protein